jgi:nitric oxide reductase activation protein
MAIYLQNVSSNSNKPPADFMPNVEDEIECMLLNSLFIPKMKASDEQ